MARSQEQSDVGQPPPGYRLPPDTRLGRVGLQVADVKRSTTFYEDILGLQILERDAGTATLGAADDGRPLVELVERRDAGPVPPEGHLGLFHVAVLLPNRSDLARFLIHAHERGVRMGMSDHLVSEALYLNDPDGLGLEVYVDRPRAAWEAVDGQLRMSTDPLDVRDLAADAGDTRWTGAPSGTAIGHVHLRVGDLKTAKAFYHGAIGFDLTVWSYPGALFLSAGGYHHHLGMNTWARSARPAGEREARLLEWRIVLPDAPSLDAAADSVSAAGGSAARAQDDWVVTDPWGTPLRLATRD